MAGRSVRNWIIQNVLWRLLKVRGRNDKMSKRNDQILRKKEKMPEENDKTLDKYHMPDKNDKMLEENYDMLEKDERILTSDRARANTNNVRANINNGPTEINNEPENINNGPTKINSEPANVNEKLALAEILAMMSQMVENSNLIMKQTSENIDLVMKLMAENTSLIMNRTSNLIINQNISQLAKRNNELKRSGDNEKDFGAGLRDRGTSSQPSCVPVYQDPPQMSDPPRLSDGIDPTFTEWEALINTKFLIDANHYSTKMAKMKYLFERTTRGAKRQLQLLCRNKRCQSTEDIIEHLATIYYDPRSALREVSLSDGISSSIEKDLEAMALGQFRADNDRQVDLAPERTPYNQDISLCLLCGEPGHNWEDTSMKAGKLEFR